MSMRGCACSTTVPPRASVPIVIDCAVPCSSGLIGSVTTFGVAGSTAIVDGRLEVVGRRDADDAPGRLATGVEQGVEIPHDGLRRARRAAGVEAQVGAGAEPARAGCRRHPEIVS